MTSEELHITLDDAEGLLNMLRKQKMEFEEEHHCRLGNADVEYGIPITRESEIAWTVNWEQIKNQDTVNNNGTKQDQR